MATTDTEVQNLIVNKLTLDQYKTAKTAGTLSETESYEITDIDTAIDAKTLPPQSGQSGKYLTTDGTNASWATVSGSGGTWGTITGTLSDQTDLQTALDDKLDTTQITNCITEIPQDIKLSLNNGTLTLQSGSKVYVPNGPGVFDEITVPLDRTLTSSATWQFMVLYNKTSRKFYRNADMSRHYSGNTAPKNPIDQTIWYDTTNNLVKVYLNGAWTSDWSFPLAVITANGSISSIDQVFNGFGYIGSRDFVLPGVKYLIPNGRNADGTLKNIEVTTSTVYVNQTDGGNGIEVLSNDGKLYPAYYRNFAVSDKQPSFANGDWYKPNDNYVYRIINGVVSGVNSSMSVAEMTYSGRIISLTPKTAFHAVDYNDFADLKNTVDTIDSNVVHKTGDETISGTKTFNSEIDIGAGEYKKSIYRQSNGSFAITMNKQDNSGWMSYIQMSTAGRVVINAGDATATDRVIALQGNSATAPTPATADNSTKIATTAYVKAQGYAVDSGLVHTTGNESISGAKTFNNTTIYGADTNYKKSGTAADLTKRATTAENWFGPRYVDANNVQGGLYQYMRTSSGDAECNMQVKSISTNSFSKLALIQKPDGTSYATLSSTPATSDSSNKIATTAYVNNKHQVVSTLPASPNANVFYYIPE